MLPTAPNLCDFGTASTSPPPPQVATHGPPAPADHSRRREGQPCQTSCVDEWDQLRRRLADEGVAGAEDLGRFVSKPQFFGESRFDERAAMYALIEVLPTLSDPKLVSVVAGHLRRPWARPAAFDALLAAFEIWAAQADSAAGWHLGDALGTTATTTKVDALLRVSCKPEYGSARQMVVLALGRFKKCAGVSETLLALIDDPDVGLHAMGALRRVLGPLEALPHFERVEREQQGTLLGEQAAREAKKARKALA